MIKPLTSCWIHLGTTDNPKSSLIIQNIKNSRLGHSDTWRELGECYKICLHWTMGREEKYWGRVEEYWLMNEGLKKTELPDDCWRKTELIS